MEKDSRQSLSEFFDELLQRTDIVKTISAYVPLQKRGNTYWGCCPFHNEKTPSFSVTESKQLFHCFGCKEGGNALTFIKKIESVETMDAVKILAKNVGMEIPSFSYNKVNTVEINEKRERLYSLMRQAARFYHESLYSNEGEIAREYLNRRGIDNSLIKKFGIGYSPDSKSVINHLKSLGYTDEEMKESAITAVSENGTYDVFYKRLIIPIINAFKEVVAFGGRTLEKNPDFAKYRNSSQTIIFDKSKTIYGINLLKDRKQKSNPIEYIIMTEGYMDVIALHKAGFDTAVASMGTALTFSQAKLLRNYCNKIYISYDGDTAGQKATLRGLDILSEAGLNVKVITLPKGLDPDDVIKNYGREFYERLIEDALPLPTFKINALKLNYNLADSEEKAKFAVEAVNIVKKLDNPIEHEEYLKLIHELTGYSMTALYSQAQLKQSDTQELPRTYEPSITTVLTESPIKEADAKIEKAELFVLATLASNADYADFFLPFDEILTSDFKRNLAKRLVEFKKNGAFNLSSLYTENDENATELSLILNYNFVEGDGKVKFDNCISVLKINMAEKEQKQLVEEYNKTKNGDILKKYKLVEEKLRELRSSVND